MPIYSVTYFLPNKLRNEPSRFLCNKCGAEPIWHRGDAGRPDFPIQVHCDAGFNQCAEFLTEELKNEQIAEIHLRALLLNVPVRFERPDFD